MNSYRISGKAALLIFINWFLFAVSFAWTSKQQGSLLWLRDLNWSGWLTDLGGMTQLAPLSAGTLWILWVVSGCLLTIASLSRKASKAPPQVADLSTAKKQLLSNADMMESHPELKEKLLRLHQSLDKI